MNSFFVLCLVTLAVTVQAKPKSGASYTTRYDNIDVQQILNNDRTLLPFLKCALGTGRCTPDGRELKSHIREALENNCGKCTKKQKEGSRKVIAHLINNKPSYWNQLVAKYDPKHKYTTRYEAELRVVKKH